MKKIEVLKEMQKRQIFSNRAYVCPKKVSEMKFKKINPDCKSDLTKYLKAKGATKVCVLQTHCKTQRNGYQYTPIACIYQDAEKSFWWFTDVVPSKSLSNLTK